MLHFKASAAQIARSFDTNVKAEQLQPIARTQSADSSLFQLPDFSRITAHEMAAETKSLLDTLRQRLEVVRNGPATFEAVVHGIEEIRHELARRWSPYSHLNMVQNDAEFQEAFIEALGDVTRFSTVLSQDAGLYKALRLLADDETASPDAPARELIRKMLRDFELAGVALPEDQQREFVTLAQRLSAQQAEFSNRLQQCTDAWSWHTESETSVAGIPATVLRQAVAAAREAGQSGWLFSLTQPTYQAVITHCSHRPTREQFYRAWMTRASSEGEHPEGFDNSDLITDILDLRQRMAALLGFDNYAQMSLAPKMAKSVPEVQAFLKDLAQRSRASAERELQTLTAAAGHAIEAWDVPYFLEVCKSRDFAISDEQLRPYFNVPAVLQGVFDLASRLFGVKFEAQPLTTAWHPDVRFFKVTDVQGQSIGGFYLDLYARGGKRGGAWIDECVVRKSLPGSSALPVGYLVCNFTPGEGDTEAQLSHQEVVTLFHEFGHMLHHLLTQVAYPSIAGINGVPWDAVELPSQFMEHYAWHYDVLRSCSSHVDTGEPIPKTIFDRLYQARNAGAGLQMLRQLEFAIFDFDLHAHHDASAPGVLRDILNKTRELTSLVQPPEWNRFENGFTHIFAGGYAAGYYSYKWAEVLAADAFAAFEEAGNVFDLTTATRFREAILEIGGSRDIAEAFEDFRGRAARIDALLQRDGIIAA
ncbi:MAG: M3 family metallopeptidase [Pseudomonadota bacterium]